MNLYFIREYLKKNFFNYPTFLMLMFVNAFTNVFVYASNSQNVPSLESPFDMRSVHYVAGVHSNNACTECVTAFAAPSLLNRSVSIDKEQNIIVAFDELDGNSRTLYVSFVHCNANWNVSDLMEVEFVEGFNKIYDLETARLSFNTTVDYVHYDIVVPTDVLG